jgi:hypothetical protein
MKNLIGHPAWIRTLTRQIETRQTQQAERRVYAASLQSLIDYHDRELANLQAQLNRYRNRMGAPCDDPQPSVSLAPSADTASNTSREATSS